MDPKRIRGIAAVCLFLAASSGFAAEKGHFGAVRLLIQSSPLAGFRHYQAHALWSELRVGDELELVREPDNPHDPLAIRVLWRGHMLGYVPRRENAGLSRALARGDGLRARISHLSRHPNPARRLRFEVYLE